MNVLSNKLPLAGDTFKPKIHLRQPRFVYSACRTFTNKKKKEKRDSRYIYKNDLDKACFQDDLVHGAVIRKFEKIKVRSSFVETMFWVLIFHIYDW